MAQKSGVLRPGRDRKRSLVRLDCIGDLPIVSLRLVVVIQAIEATIGLLPVGRRTTQNLPTRAISPIALRNQDSLPK